MRFRRFIRRRRRLLKVKGKEELLPQGKLKKRRLQAVIEAYTVMSGQAKHLRLITRLREVKKPEERAVDETVV